MPRSCAKCKRHIDRMYDPICDCRYCLEGVLLTSHPERIRMWKIRRQRYETPTTTTSVSPDLHRRPFPPHHFHFIANLLLPFISPKDVVSLALLNKEVNKALSGERLDTSRHAVYQLQADWLAESSWTVTGVYIMGVDDLSTPFARLHDVVNLRLEGLMSSVPPLNPLNVTLQSIDLTECFLLTCVQELPYLSMLNRIDLTECEKLSDIDCLNQCVALQWLCLDDCSSLTDINDLSGCLALTSLYAAHCWNLVNISGLANCLKLRRLYLGTCPNLVDLSALPSCPALEVLDVSKYRCEDHKPICFDGLEQLASLTDLDLRGTRVENLVQLGMCPSLTRLDLSHAKYLNDVSHAMDFPCLTHLRACSRIPAWYSSSIRGTRAAH